MACSETDRHEGIRAGRQIDRHRARQTERRTHRQTETDGYSSQAGILNVKN